MKTKKIKTDKFGYRYIGKKSDYENILWECKSCGKFKKYPHIVGFGDGVIICSDCIVKGKGKELLK